MFTAMKLILTALEVWGDLSTLTSDHSSRSQTLVQVLGSMSQQHFSLRFLGRDAEVHLLFDA